MVAEARVVLLVDDKPDDARLIAEVLSGHNGVQVKLEQASHLSAGIERAKQGGVDLILLDLDLPDSKGFDAFLELHFQMPHIPVVLLVGDNEKELAEKALHEGAEDCLRKDEITRSILTRVVRNAITRGIAKAAEEEALRRVKELTETKTRIVARASHELRTPLGIIQGFASLVHDGLAGPIADKQKECLDSVLKNCDRLADLIDTILNLAKLESGKADISRRKMRMDKLLAECHQDLLPAFEQRKQSLVLEVGENLPEAYCDEDNIWEALSNLLENANKFTQEGGCVRLGCQHEGQFLRVYVADNGPGIAEEDQERIFEAFSQAENPNSQGPKGAGLGLAIVTQLVHLNGGSLWVDSERGKGSCFSFTVPLYETGAPRRVLIVDDDIVVVTLMKRILKQSDLNLEVRSTQSGLDSLMIAGQFSPNLVILDLCLTEVGGEQVLASYKNQMKGTGKVLLISGDHELLKNLAARSSEEYMSKPFSGKELLQKVIKLLGIERRSR